jgi:hypothetical protein
MMPDRPLPSELLLSFLYSRLRADLFKASHIIAEKNKTRKYVYDICDPMLIPNSISI